MTRLPRQDNGGGSGGAASPAGGAESERMMAHARVLTRPVIDLLLDEIAYLTKRCDGDYIMSIVELSILQATRPISDAEAGRRRTISVRAIGTSLGLPYETCRRKVRDLEAAGRCRRVSANRLVIAYEGLETPAYQADCEARWRSLREHLVELRDIGIDFNQFGQVSPQNPVKAPNLSRAVAALMDDYLLRLVEARRANTDIIDSNVITAMMNMNGEPVRRDRELTWKYAAGDTPPPDSVRAPVTIAMIARRLNMSEDVVGRRVKMYVQQSLVRRVHGGYLFVMAEQLTPDAHRSRNLVNQRFLQLVQALRQLGIDPAAVSLD